ncbi:type II secretion system protein GspG [Rhizobium rhizosphaerae]|uniref:Type II secretion system core protein G n=1 Tax=Xaviernesmea rhizosphaerae TaxID=1672749 RepID=A0A1Q9AI73_9HYPH|nr:type II secretion system major pseudopilin GspG [Xaviernesmea rhizosphaerae]OLP54953.1 type II secretion system protein GspG [Xaviernesmea rhizosphaerae]
MKPRGFEDRRPARRDRKGGFTLVELLVVLVILGLVMGLVGPRVLSYLSSSRTRAAALQISAFKSSLDLFYLDMGRYPTRAEGLAALVTRPGGAQGWNGPYLQQPSVPLDPWGHAYQYSVPGTKGPYRILSYGADGVAGGTGADADIVSE